jgi:hypothetical protein
MTEVRIDIDAEDLAAALARLNVKHYPKLLKATSHHFKALKETMETVPGVEAAAVLFSQCHDTLALFTELGMQPQDIKTLVDGYIDVEDAPSTTRH